VFLSINGHVWILASARLGVVQDDRGISPLVLGLLWIGVRSRLFDLAFSKGVLLCLVFAGDGDSYVQFRRIPPQQDQIFPLISRTSIFSPPSLHLHQK